MSAGDLLLVFLAFAAGGLLKGAMGAGAPLLAVPLMSSLRDVPFAVAVFVLPNIVPNLWQYWLYRRSVADPRLARGFAVAGGVGAAAGTVALAGLPSEVLLLGVGLVLVTYIGFRLLNPAWHLARARATRVAVPVGILAGMLQGATGLSAPVSLTFLSAIRPSREEFMATASLFFVALGLVQLPAQIHFGIMTVERFGYSLLALIPLLLFMPLGGWIGRRLPRDAFEKLVLALLAALAVEILLDSLF
ncbi:sulfite exporter TauE/SafE family protein [Sinisalibacter lacisalsi]|uniref:Probable membrane transporter protein n=1 Tax=Sinisalibacter lacisalsi TaxID=1526570 RepID=A0ABQ1QV22_9RHOB|nr:sulfite exporter TauE/SafE family protein [Sinisalibacter lacisalsi]GGD44794.1 hypothetical protein GCM10011358_30680 [Sinisalibacter lacisalsi]